MAELLQPARDRLQNKLAGMAQRQGEGRQIVVPKPGEPNGSNGEA